MKSILILSSILLVSCDRNSSEVDADRSEAPAIATTKQLCDEEKLLLDIAPTALEEFALRELDPKTPREELDRVTSVAGMKTRLFGMMTNTSWRHLEPEEAVDNLLYTSIYVQEIVNISAVCELSEDAQQLVANYVKVLIACHGYDSFADFSKKFNIE